MPKERCVRKCPAHGRLWLPGEVREISDFDEDGQPIVTDHFRLIEDDEQVDLEKVYDQDELKQKKAESNARDREAAIKTALQKMDPDNSRHWTRGGLPSLQFLCTETGLDLTRGEVHAVAPDFDQDAARKAS